MNCLRFWQRHRWGKWQDLSVDPADAADDELQYWDSDEGA